MAAAVAFTNVDTLFSTHVCISVENAQRLGAGSEFCPLS